MELLGQPDLGGKNGSEVLSKKLWAVVDYTDAMTRDVAVKDSVFEKLREHFSEQEVVEVTATVSVIRAQRLTRGRLRGSAC
jgi:alkylhydroperoxidase family enzyme